MSYGQVFQLKTADSNPNQFKHRMADCFEHPSDLPVFSLRDREFEPCVLLGRSDFANDRRSRPLVPAYIEPVGESEIFVRRDDAGDFAIVGLWDARTRLQQCFPKLGI